MKKLLIFLFIFTCSSMLFAEGTYWLLYDDVDTNTHQTLLAIDHEGTILVDPHVIHEGNADLLPIVGALGVDANGRTRLFLNDASSMSSPRILSSLLDLEHLTITSPKYFGVSARGELAVAYLQATQNPGLPFIIFERSDSNGTSRLVKAFGVDLNGHFDGDSWRISPRTEGSFIEAGVSADGRAAWSTAHLDLGDKLYIQPLRTNGLPDGAPFVAATSNKDNEAIYSADISNELPNGYRIVVYGLIADLGGSNGYTFYAQAVNLATRKKVGTRKLLSAGEVVGYEAYQHIAISPDGGFATFIDHESGDCGGTGAIMFQAIDNLGNKLGSTMELIPCDPNFIKIGLDILHIE